MNDENKKENYFAKLKGYEKAMPITFAALAVFTAVCVFSHGTGFLGDGIGKLLRGVFSVGGYFIPFLLAIHALCYAEDKNKKRFIPRLFFSLTVVIIASVTEYAICFWGDNATFAPTDFYSEEINGGFIGGVIGFALVKMIGNIGAIVFVAAILAIYAIFFYADRTGEFGQKALDIAGIVFGFLAKTEGQVKQKIADKKNEKAEREEEEHRNRSDELLNDSFFESNGVENLKIDELGIGKDIPEEVVETPARPQRKRNADKPLDLNYGIEVPAPTEDEKMDKKEEKSEDAENNILGDVYGIEDSAEKVFTKAFDPFNFATGEKIASKPSSKATFEEELDDITIAEMRSEPSDREKRIMELEKRKKMWLDRNKAASAEINSTDKPQHKAAVVEDNTTVIAERAESSESQTPAHPEYTRPQHFTAPQRADIPKEVNTYTSYSSTQTTYTQPIKTVEFTINGNAAPAPAEPVESNEVTKSYEKSDGIDRETEDVAAFIAEKIARANPAYARSANEMVTYTKVTPSPGDLLASEAEVKNYESFADKIIADSHITEDDTLSEGYSENSEDPLAETTESAIANDVVIEEDVDPYFPAASDSNPVAEEISGFTVEATDVPFVEGKTEFSFDKTESTETASNIETLLFNDPDILSDSDDVFEYEADSEAPIVEELLTEPCSNETAETEIHIADNSAHITDENRPIEAENGEAVIISDNSCPITEGSAVPDNEACNEAPLLDNSEIHPNSINLTKASYERAAGFVSGMSLDATDTPKEFVPEFKPYEAPAVSDITPSYENVSSEETLKVERTMLPPTVESTVSVPVETVVTAPVANTNPAPVESTISAPVASAIPLPVENTASNPIAEATAASSLETTFTFAEEEVVPTFVAVDESSSWTGSEDVSGTQIPDEKIDWENEEESSDTPSSMDESNETISFIEDDVEEEDEADALEEAAPAPDSFNTLPEEDDVQTEEIPPEEQNPDVIKMREMFPFLNPIGTAPTDPKAQETSSEPISVEDEDLPPFDDAVVKTTPTSSLISMEEAKKEEKKSNKPDYSNYEFPSIELLAKEDAFSDENIQAEIQENADKLIETLASFGVTASIKGVDRGPRITRYEVVPAKGVKVSSILNLQDDIALNLAAGSIRMEAPIPGKSAVGIEIPNKKSSTVRLRNLLETEDFQSSKSKTAVCIGRDVAGQPVFGDIAKMPHLLIAGATGMGKSVCINSLMISILYKARPDEVKFIMIDPKQVEFTMYNGIPHLLVPVVSDAKQAAGALMWAVEEMEKRYNLLNPLCVRNIEAYNEKVAADPSLGEPMSKIVIVIDEFADLMLQVKDPVETLVMRIAQKARAAGIYLVIGTQRPSVNVITGVIKANVPSRISCKVMSNVDSKTVLDSAGAEKLLDRGDMLYAPAGSPKPHRVQGAFVADGEVEAIMAHLKKFSDGSNYDSTVMEEIERAAQKCSKKGGGGADHDDGDDEVHGEGYLNDRQFLDAVEVAVNTRKISTSLIQRKLSIGYGKAAKFIDIMEDMGIVGEANGQRPREVLITPDEWREKLARATLD